MKVLVVGGTGFVGRRLRSMLADAGHHVRLLVRPGSGSASPDERRYEVLHGDVFNTNACLRACDSIDAIVNLVGIIREYPNKGVTFEQYHVAATRNLLDAGHKQNVPRFLQMSALGTRADAHARYHRTKFEAEQLVRNSGLRWTIFQPSWIFAPGDNLSLQILDLLDMPILPLIDHGDNVMQPISREDVCRVMTKSLSMPETQGETFELGGPDRMKFADIVQKFADQDNRVPRTLHFPVWSLRPVVRIMERFPSFPLTTDQLAMLREDNVCEIDHFVKTFGIQPESFVRAIPQLARRTVDAEMAA